MINFGQEKRKKKKTIPYIDANTNHVVAVGIQLEAFPCCKLGQSLHMLSRLQNLEYTNFKVSSNVESLLLWKAQTLHFARVIRRHRQKGSWM